MVEYSPAEEAQEIAKKLIEKHHSRLKGAKIEWIFRSKGAKKRGTVVLGNAAKLSAKLNYMTDATFVIELAEDRWGMLTKDQQRALVDHQLCHCDQRYDKKGNRVWCTRDHDFEDFYSVIERHGLWKKDLKHLGEVVKQLNLDFEKGEAA